MFIGLFAALMTSLSKGVGSPFEAIRGDSCRQYEFAENLAE